MRAGGTGPAFPSPPEEQDVEFMTDIPSQSVAGTVSSIKEAERITIVTHTHPDGDAMGSSAGLYHYLRALGKEVCIAINDRHPGSLSFLTSGLEGDVSVYGEQPEATVGRIMDSGLVFCLDMNSFDRAESLGTVLKGAGCRKILIDHHLNPSREEFDIIFSETGISSTSELLYYILLSLPWTEGKAENLPARTAEALMAGMTTDTNNFANSVYPSTFRMASELLAAGTDRDGIISRLYHNYRENRFRLQGELLKDNLRITSDGVAYMIIDKALADRYDIQDGETEGFVNLPLGIGKVRMSLLLKEEDDRFRVSIRSRKGVSANMCASMYFNGGGHELAAGGRLVKGQDIPAETGAAEIARYVESRTAEFFRQKK